MNKIILLFSTLLLSVLFASTVYAVAFDAKENLLISENITDDAYMVGGNATVEAEVFGDLLIGGGTVSVNSIVHEDLVVVGGRVTIVGDVLGDVRIFGGQVSIFGNVGDDLIIGGGQVEIAKNSNINGSLIAGAGILQIDGTVGEDVRGGVGMLLLNGTVNGNVIVSIEDKLLISNKARIYGDLKYSSFLEAEIPAKVVAGEVVFNQFEREKVLENITYALMIRKLLSFISSLILALLFVLFAPKILLNASKITKEGIFRAFGIGLLAVFLAIIGGTILMFTVIGIPIGLIVFALFLIVFYVSKIFVAGWLSSYFINYNKNFSKAKLFGGLSLALLVYYLVGIIPYIGWILSLILFLIGVGTIVLLRNNYFAFMKKKGFF